MVSLRAIGLGLLFVFAVLTMTVYAQEAAETPLKKVYKSVESLPQKVYGHQINAKAVLDSDETWTPDNVYLVFGPFSTGKFTLTIQAGTVVLFNDDQLRKVSPPHGSLSVEEGGAVKILGTAEKHVVLAPFDAEDLFWDGISTGFGYKEFTIEHTDFYKSGAGAGAGAIATLHSDKEPAVRLKNVTFHELQNKGFRLWNETGLSTDSSVTIFGYTPKVTDPQYQYPVMNVDPVAAGTLTKENFVVKEGVPVHARVIYVSTPMLNKSVTYRDLGMPYRVDELQVPGDTYGGPPVTLTLEPGVVMQVGSIIYVGGKTGTGESDMGNIVAVGTKEKPIRFTSAKDQPKAGDWQSIFMRAGSFDPKVSKFEYCIIEYGGSVPANAVWHDVDQRGNVGSLIAIMNPPRSEPYDGPQIAHTT
ncbi:MAG: hypothetical protein RDV41_14675, partial [Planctomycetota bacterium]|nr:hypothetical protein [Planctomycetota bacterium]